MAVSTVAARNRIEGAGVYGSKTNPLNAGDLRVDRSARPDWATGLEVVPAVGQKVYCTAGMAEVVAILGKTGNGSRLLQLRLMERAGPTFHVAASNVLVEPAGGGAGAVPLAPPAPEWIGNTPASGQ
jgi:hypothetical protein